MVLRYKYFFVCLSAERTEIFHQNLPLSLTGLFTTFMVPVDTLYLQTKLLHLVPLSNKLPSSSGFVPFSPALLSPALLTGRLVCALILHRLLSFPDSSGSPASPVPSLPNPDLPQKKYITSE